MLLKQRLYVGLLCLFVSIALVLTIALSLPETPWKFSVSTEQALQVSKGDGTPIAIDFFIIDTKKIPALNDLALDEPDTVNTYVEFNQLMAMNNLLLSANESLYMQLTDDTVHSLDITARQLTDLPPMFWLQITCGSLGFLICVLIKSTGNRQRGVNDFVLTGFSYLLFTFAAAIYSTRNLLIDGQLFHTLSMLNHAGAMLFSAALCAFLWNYPKVVGGYALSVFAYLVFVLNMIVDGFQLTEGPATGSYAWVFGLFLFALLGSAVQWWLARKNPLDRGAVRWLLLSIYVGTIFFAGGMMLPILLGIPPLASQGLMFTTFLLMYGGLALGVIRYRLFDLEAWWFSVWAWFLGGIAILFVDVLLVSFLTLSSTAALAFATAIVGWLYFPIRQWCWQHLSYRKGFAVDVWLPQILSKLITVKTPLQLENAWLSSVKDFYRPLNVENAKCEATDAEIQQNGLQLVMPQLTRSGSIVLSNASEGQRLFTRNDIKNFNVLWSIFDLMNKTLLARAEGANAERDRIRQDIHDDLGAKLLSIQISSKDKELGKLANEALVDLNNLLQSIEIEPIALTDALKHWHLELRERASNNMTIDWQVSQQIMEFELSPEQFSQLTRVVRESFTNALKHSKLKKLVVTIKVDRTLDIQIVNDGVISEKNSTKVGKEPNTGRGSSILRKRCERLGGSFKSWQDDEYWLVLISVPLA